LINKIALKPQWATNESSYLSSCFVKSFNFNLTQIFGDFNCSRQIEVLKLEFKQNTKYCWGLHFSVIP